MSMPSIEQVVSRYLFNRDVPPADLTDESIIRLKGKTGDSIVVDMNEFMTSGGGRFAGVERFNFVRNLFALQLIDFLGIRRASQHLYGVARA